MSCADCKYLHECKRQCMELPTGCSCQLCVHVNRCVAMFGAKPENTHCDFYPVRFKLRDDPAFVKSHGLEARE